MTTEVTTETVTAFNNNNSYTSVITTNVNNRFFVEDEDRIAENRRALQAAGLAPVHPSIYTSRSQPTPFKEKIREILRCIIEKGTSSPKELKTMSKDDYLMVFIWDIEEVTQLSWNYVAEFTQCYPHVNAACLYELVERILMSVNFKSSSELKEGNIVNIDDEVDVESEFIKRVAPKYNALRQLYNEIPLLKDNSWEKWKPYPVDELLVKCGMSDRRTELRHAVEDMYWLSNGRWQYAFRCMDLINKGSQKTEHKYGNVVLSGDGIGYAAAQMLVSTQAPLVPIENIYSTAKASKESVFERIRRRFGEKCTLVSVTSSSDTSAVAEKLKIPVWRIETNYSLKCLSGCLPLDFIKDFEPHFAKARRRKAIQRIREKIAAKKRRLEVST